MTFKNRAAEYNYAVQKYPHVLINELSTAAHMVNAKPNEVIVNMPGACVDISKYIPESVVYKPYETNLSFSLGKPEISPRVEPPSESNSALQSHAMTLVGAD